MDSKREAAFAGLLVDNKDLMPAKIQWWRPGMSLPRENPEVTALTGTLYECNQPGYGNRTLSFLTNGAVGNDKGCPIGEVYWDIRMQDDDILLSIHLDDVLVCELRPGKDKVWKGEWKMGAEVEIELRPVGDACPLQQDHSTPIVHVRLSGQLGNCLRNIASIEILSNSLGITWDIDLNQSASPPEVNAVIQDLFPGRINRYPPDSYIFFGERKLMQFVDIYGTNSHPVVEATVAAVPSFSFGTRHIYASRPSSMTDAEYVRSKFSFYKNIAWPADLLESAQRFIDKEANGSLAGFTGCHIRYTDNFSDMRKQELNFNTALSTFIDRLAQLSGEPIFLCTDNPAVRTEIVNALPKANILFPDVYTGNNGLWQPLYEMYLLGCTKYLIGSLSSTFSYEACFLSGIDIELFRNNTWNLYPISQYHL